MTHVRRACTFDDEKQLSECWVCSSDGHHMLRLVKQCCSLCGQTASVMRPASGSFAMCMSCVCKQFEFHQQKTDLYLRQDRKLNLHIPFLHFFDKQNQATFVEKEKTLLHELKKLIDQKADPSQDYGSSKGCILREAINSHSYEAVKLLLEAKADVKGTDDSEYPDQTPIKHALQQFNPLRFEYSPLRKNIKSDEYVDHIGRIIILLAQHGANIPSVNLQHVNKPDSSKP